MFRMIEKHIELYFQHGISAKIEYNFYYNRFAFMMNIKINNKKRGTLYRFTNLFHTFILSYTYLYIDHIHLLCYKKGGLLLLSLLMHDQKKVIVIKYTFLNKTNFNQT